MPDGPNPERPLPWKAVQIGGVWDVTNAAGDPRDEYSVCEHMTEGEARFIVRAVNAHADLLAAAELALRLLSRASDDTVGYPDEVAREQLRAAIAKAKGGAA